jgi:hypothetical protein
MGIKSNFNVREEDYFVRTDVSHEQYVATHAQVGVPMQLVGKLEKVDGEYRRFSLWVNETPGILKSLLPEVTGTISIGFTSVNRLGFRTANLDSAPLDRLLIDDLVIADSLFDVLAPPLSTSLPEPGSLAAWSGAGLMVFALVRRRHRRS